MIVFTTGIEPNRLYMAFNNHVVRFRSNTIGAEPLYCDITAGSALNVRLYPDPLGNFFFNFKPYVSALINRRNFNDNTNVEINSNEPQAFVYGFNHGTFLQLMVNFRITLLTEETETTEVTGHALSWLAGVEQINDYNNFNSNGLYVLSPFRKLSATDYYLKYWQGYPFDMPFYTSGTGITLYNETNLLSASFSILGYGERLFFSDGRTDESLEDLLPLVEGYNKLKLSGSGTANDKYIMLEKMGYKSGVYLKWLNKYGGYSYWLFEDTYSVDRSTKHLGEIDRDNANLTEANTRTNQIGKESQDTIKIIAELLTEDERRIVEGILDSPKIYLFTGQPYSRSSLKDWTEVTLKTTNARLKNAKQPLTNFTFDIELPVRYTQRL